jgi:hypothetical protein
MTNAEIGQMLRETGLPVFYDHGKVGTELPYITYTTASDNFFADSRTYQKVYDLRVVLYTATKRPDLEELLEAVFDGHDISWNRDEVYENTEEVFQEIYESEVFGNASNT